MITQISHVVCRTKNRLLQRLDRIDPSRLLDGLIEWLEGKSSPETERVAAAPTAPTRRSLASGLPFRKQFFRLLTLKELRRMATVQPTLMGNMARSARYYKKHFRPVSTIAGPTFYEEVEQLARSLGAKNIGYLNGIEGTEIFRGKAIPAPNAIVFTVDEDRDAINSTPSFDSFYEIQHAYMRLSVISTKLAQHIRKKGYSAYPGTALGGMTDYVVLAERAGLGAIGYHGLLIAPTDDGARVRICVIYTDLADLPVKTDNSHAWVRDFCAKCRNCIRTCPVGAIHDVPQDREGGGKRCIDHQVCVEYFAGNYLCGVCQKTCPFSDKGYDHVKQAFFSRPAADKWAAVAATPDVRVLEVESANNFVPVEEVLRFRVRS